MNTEHNNGALQRAGSFMFAMAWITVLVLLAMWFSEDEERRNNPNQDPETISLDGQRTLVLHANRQNHFVSTGLINGKKVTLLLDTGATNVTIPADMGERLGLERGYQGVADTANGRVNIYATRIDRLEIGEILLQDVAANLNPGMNGSDAILLGMSALSRVQFSQRDGKLYLVQ